MQILEWAMLLIFQIYTVIVINSSNISASLSNLNSESSMLSQYLRGIFPLNNPVKEGIGLLKLKALSLEFCQIQQFMRTISHP